jgi:O-antigen ligase
MINIAQIKFSFNFLLSLYLITLYIYLPAANIIMIVLLLLGIYYITGFNLSSFNKYDKLIISIFILSPLCIGILQIYHNEPLREFDNFSRFFLLLPIYLLSKNIKLNSTLFAKIFFFIPFIILVNIIITFDFNDNSLRYMGSSNVAITYGNLIMSLIIFSLTIIKKKSLPLFGKFLPFISILILLFIWGNTGTKGSLIGLVFVILFILSYRIYSPSIKMLAITLPIAFVVILSTPIYDRMSDSYNHFLLNSKVTDHSTQERIYMYEKFVEIISNTDSSLLYGIGSKNLEEVISNSESELNYSISYDHLHNDFIDIIAKYGLVSFFFFSLTYLVPFIIFTKFIHIKGYYYISLLGIFHILSTTGYSLTQTITAHHQSITFFIIISFILLGQISFKYDNNSK